MKDIKTKICKICGIEKPINEFNSGGNNKYKYCCKICGWKKNKEIMYDDIFTENVVDIILDSILNAKIKYLNELEDILNISLDDIINYVSKLKIKNKMIRIKCICTFCNKEFERIITQYKNRENLYCSKECYDKAQSMSINMVCAWCGKEICKTPRKGQINYFCNHDCSAKFHAKEKIKPLITVKCQYCGNDFERKEYETSRIYCSIECRKLGFREKVSGKNSVLYKKRLKVICDWCGNEFEELESSYNDSKNHFCCNNCRNIYHAKITQQSEEYKQKARDNMIKTITNGLISHTKTNPQIIINELLDNLNIKYKNEYPYKYYSVDNYLLKYNLILEVMGTFWHCDNRKYESINSIIQVESIKRDKAKKTYMDKYFNINILYLWEYDILNNLELCKQLILEYINNKGILNNYHSFNYYLSDYLNINNDIIIPYMNYNINELNKIIDLSVRELKSRYDVDKHISFNCEWCGKESTDNLLHFKRYDHHFCSRKCNSFYYGNKKLKTNNICNICGENIPHKNGLCKVCLFKSERNLKYNSIWTEELTNIILNNIIYKKIAYLNELENLLLLPLKDILEYMVKTLKLRTKIRVKKICLQCGKEIFLPANRIINGKDKYCSPECSQLSQRDMIINFKCDNCGKNMERKNGIYNKTKNHFCSHGCADIYNGKQRKNRIVMNCIICDKEFEVIPSRKNAITCSRECQIKWQSQHRIYPNNLCNLQSSPFVI